MGKTVTLDATVLFQIVCPPPAPTPTSCVATGYLAADGLAELPANAEDAGILLFDRGHPVGCVASSLSGLTCQGWRHAARYRVRGVLAHRSASGRQLPNLQFDASEHTPRG